MGTDRKLFIVIVPPREGGGLLPHSSNTGMCCPTGSCILDFDLERPIIFKPFCRAGCNIANAQKLQNIIDDFNNKLEYQY